jgi:hypothetical protein
MTKLLVACLLVAAPAQAQTKTPHIDLVIALDVSGSMRGLIDATRVKLWDVVRLLGRAQPQPEVRVGLITFGGKYYDPAAGWVRRELDLTSDLDAVSERLLSLQVRGSQEYVARTVLTAVHQLSWDPDPASLKIVFVAGNESAEQDPQVSLARALGEARQRGIHVNTIYCGSPVAHESFGWRRVARLGGGEFAAIDHNESQLAQLTPYDAELGRLSQALSGTYVGYGDAAKEHVAKQKAEDANASAAGPQVAASRAEAKASHAYNNDNWDLIDAYAHKKAVDKLPASLAGMSGGEREAFVRGRLEERQELQRRIHELSGKRDAFLAQPAMPMGSAPPVATTTPAHHSAKPAKHRSMDEALVGTVRKQAMDSGLAF